VPDVKLHKTWDTASHYHLIHSLALLYAASARPDTPVPAALFAGGITLFSGSLYALVLSGERRLGAITPIGGVLMAAGWLALAPGLFGGGAGANRPHPE